MLEGRIKINSNPALQAFSVQGSLKKMLTLRLSRTQIPRLKWLTKVDKRAQT